MTILPSGKGVLTPLQKGALVRNAGTFGGSWSQTPDRTVMRDGQTIGIYTGVWTFAGKQGTIVFRERNEWVDLGQDLNRDAYVGDIAIGTWKVVRGTGTYAGGHGWRAECSPGAGSQGDRTLRGASLLRRSAPDEAERRALALLRLRCCASETDLKRTGSTIGFDNRKE